MIIKDRLLFLKYSLPCAKTLVKRGKISQKEVDDAIKLVGAGKLPRKGFEEVFEVANKECAEAARKMGKRQIDSEVIRNYFLREHDRVVERRFRLMHDFDPKECKIYVGKVLEVKGSLAVVKTPLGVKEYKTILNPEIKENDTVVVHYEYVVEGSKNLMGSGKKSGKKSGKESGEDEQ